MGTENPNEGGAMSFFINDLKKLCKNRMILLTFALLFICAIYDPLFMQERFDIHENPYYWWLFMNTGVGSSVYNTLYWFIPAFLTGLIYFDERNSSIYGLLITRGKRSAYFASKAISLFLVTFAGLAVVFSANLILTYALCPETMPIADYMSPKANSFAYFLFHDSPLKMAFLYVFLHALALALLAVLYLCLYMVLKIKNKHIAFIVPPLFMLAINYAIELTGHSQYSLTILLQPMAASASTELLGTNQLIFTFSCLALSSLICFVAGTIRNRDAL